MKTKLLLTLILCLTCLAAMAQEKNKQKDYKWGVGMQISNPTKEVKVMWFDDGNESYDVYNIKDKSFSLGILGKYTFNNGFGIHLKTGITKIDIIKTGDYWNFSDKNSFIGCRFDNRYCRRRC